MYITVSKTLKWTHKILCKRPNHAIQHGIVVWVVINSATLHSSLYTVHEYLTFLVFYQKRTTLEMSHSTWKWQCVCVAHSCPTDIAFTFRVGSWEIAFLSTWPFFNNHACNGFGSHRISFTILLLTLTFLYFILFTFTYSISH